VSGLDPQAQAVLTERAAASGRPMRKAPVAESRAAQWEWVPYMGEPASVAHVDNRFIPTPTAEIPVRIYTPHGEGPFPALVMYHGGCWIVGNIDVADGPHRTIAATTGCVVIAVNYQKAPEHPFPVPLDDCYAGYRWALTHADELGVDPSRIGVAGDSAGGNLAAAVCLMARQRGEPQPAVQVLIYPAVDPDLDTESAKEFAEGYGLTTEDMRWTWHQYVPDEAALYSAVAAPLHASSLHGLAPAVVVTAEFDILRDEGQAYAERLAADGNASIQLRYDGAIHGFLWMAGAVDVCVQMLTDVRTALDDIWARGQPGRP